MNTMAEQDWDAFRTLVKELLHDSTTRKRIEQRTDIAPRTLSRWVSGETEEPDRKRLSILLAALPEHRDALLATITQAIPDFEPPLLDPPPSPDKHLPTPFSVPLPPPNPTPPT